MGKFSKQQEEKSTATPAAGASNQYLLMGIGVVVVLLLAWFLFLGKPNYPEINSPRPVFGNENAKIVIEEFSDFECPACQTAYAYVKPILAEFKEDIRFEYKHFPLNSECNNGSQTSHPNACIAAYASECANDQNQFWAYYDYLFTNKKLDDSSLKSAASFLKLNTESFNACLDSRAKRNIIITDVSAGNARGVSATPTFYVNGEKIENWNNLRSIILAKKAQLNQ